MMMVMVERTATIFESKKECKKIVLIKELMMSCQAGKGEERRKNERKGKGQKERGKIGVEENGWEIIRWPS